MFEGLPLTAPDYGQQLAEQPIDGGHFELYHSVLDLAEQRDLLPAQAALAEELRQELLGWYAGLERSDARKPLDPELRKEFHRHGYW